MNKLFDCHSHILYGVDDGVRTIEESAKIIGKLKKLGFSNIILTPHYDRTFRVPLSERKEKFNSLVPIAEKLGVNIFLANEVHLMDDAFETFSEISTINNNIFLEFSLTNRRANYTQYLHDLDAHGQKIILVHPERYTYLAPYEYQELHDYGLKFQMNYGSIVGLYGTEVKKRAKFLIENDLVDFFGTDIHGDSYHFNHALKRAIQKLTKMLGEKSFEQIATKNPLLLFQEPASRSNTKYAWRTDPTARESATNTSKPVAKSSTKRRKRKVI